MTKYHPQKTLKFPNKPLLPKLNLFSYILLTKRTQTHFVSLPVPLWRCSPPLSSTTPPPPNDDFTITQQRRRRHTATTPSRHHSVSSVCYLKLLSNLDRVARYAMLAYSYTCYVGIRYDVGGTFNYSHFNSIWIQTLARRVYGYNH